jgi:serine/threonine protein kinase
VIKAARDPRIQNERQALLKFQDRAPLRRLVDTIEEPLDPPAIVLKYLDDDLLNVKVIKKLSRPEIKHVAKTALSALNVLHSENYVHTGSTPGTVRKAIRMLIIKLDIKPDNILVDYKYAQNKSDIRFSEVQVADLGTCVNTSAEYAKDGTLIGAPMFRSPEACLGLRWGTPTDIWSFGATVSYQRRVL